MGFLAQLIDASLKKIVYTLSKLLPKQEARQYFNKYFILIKKLVKNNRSDNSRYLYRKMFHRNGQTNIAQSY